MFQVSARLTMEVIPVIVFISLQTKIDIMQSNILPLDGLAVIGVPLSHKDGLETNLSLSHSPRGV